jgi:hypothetical protein
MNSRTTVLVCSLLLTGFMISAYAHQAVGRSAGSRTRAWNIETIESAGEVGTHTSIVLDMSGMPHISYHDQTNGDLKYAHWNGFSWEKEVVDEAGTVGTYTSLVLDGVGNPHISYQDQSTYDLKYAYWNGSTWQITRVDSTNFVGFWSSLALCANDLPHIAHYDDSKQSLRYVWFNGTEWIHEIVDDSGFASGRFASLALDDAGHPHIAYYHETTCGALKYATKGASGWQFAKVDSIEGG